MTDETSTPTQRIAQHSACCRVHGYADGCREPVSPTDPFGFDMPDYCRVCLRAGRARYLTQTGAEAVSWAGVFHPVVGEYRCHYCGSTWTRCWSQTVLND